MAGENWVTGFRKRFPFTVAASCIDADLVDFPVLLTISASAGISNDDLTEIFDDLVDDGGKAKLAVTTEDGLVQCEVELERYDDGNEEAFLWVRVPAISSSVDTQLYLYFDPDVPDNWRKIHIQDSAGAERVWDDNYMFVSHMVDQPALEDLGDAISGAPNNAFWQGVANDGTYWYALSSQWTGTPTDVPWAAPGDNAVNVIRKYRIDTGALVQTLGNTDPHVDAMGDVDMAFSSGEVIERNGVKHLYVTARERGAASSDPSAEVVEYDLDLNQIQVHVLSDGLDGGAFGGYIIPEGVDFHDGFWWVIFGARGSQAPPADECAIGQYLADDLSATGEVAIHDLFTVPTGEFGGQEMFWIGPYDVLSSIHEGAVLDEFQFWRWTGTTFGQRNGTPQLVEASSARIGQGFTLLNGFIYLASRDDDALVKSDLTLGIFNLIRDSTVNENHGTKGLSNQPLQVDTAGLPFKQQDFDDAAFHSIDLGDNLSLVNASLSIEVVVESDSFAEAQTILYLREAFQLRLGTSGEIIIETNGLTDNGPFNSGATVLSVNTQHTIGVGFDGIGQEIKVFLDGVEVTTGDFPKTTAGGPLSYSAGDHNTIGSEDAGGSAQAPWFDGVIEEVRVSDVSRSDAWFIAYDCSIRDALLEFGALEELPVVGPLGALGSMGPAVIVGAGQSVGY